MNEQEVAEHRAHCTKLDCHVGEPMNWGLYCLLFVGAVVLILAPWLVHLLSSA